MGERKSTLGKIATLAVALGVTKINRLPGCWQHKLNDQWEFWVNGHDDSVTLESGPTVHPYSAYVEYNGWPAGFFHAAGGWFAAGSCANIDEFEAVLTTATEGARHE